MAGECRTYNEDANLYSVLFGKPEGQILWDFVVDTVALGQAFLTILRFSSVSIIPPTYYTHVYSNIDALQIIFANNCVGK